MRPTPRPDAWCNEWEFLSSITMTEMMTPEAPARAFTKALGGTVPSTNTVTYWVNFLYSRDSKYLVPGILIFPHPNHVAHIASALARAPFAR